MPPLNTIEATLALRDYFKTNIKSTHHQTHFTLTCT